jgi:hypothetical protein
MPNFKVEKIIDSISPKERKEILRRTLPPIVEMLLRQEKIDKERLKDKEYLMDIIHENSEMVEDLRGYTTLDDGFLQTAIDSVNSGKLLVPIVLVATAIEHQFNMFYRDILEAISGLDEQEATEAIRSNLHVKTGWLMKLATGQGLSKELKNQIKQISDLRNAIVHYKARSAHIDDDENNEYNKIKKRAVEIGMETILDTPSRLKTELNEITKSIAPSLTTASNIVDFLLEDE